MKFAVNTLLWTASFSLDDLPLLGRIREWGFDGVEIARYDFNALPARVLREAVRNEGLEPLLCSALVGGMSLARDDPRTRQAADDFLRRAAEAAAELGSPLLAGPFVSAVGLLPGRRATEEEWKRAVDGVAALVPVLREHGVTLALEPLNCFETYLLNTCADMRRFCDAVRDPCVGALFDDVPRQHRREMFRRCDPCPRPAPPALPRLRERPRHAGHRPRAVGRGLRRPAGDRLRRLVRHRKLRGARAGNRCCGVGVEDLAPDAGTLARQGLGFLRDAAARAMGAAASAI